MPTTSQRMCALTVLCLSVVGCGTDPSGESAEVASPASTTSPNGSPTTTSAPDPVPAGTSADGVAGNVWVGPAADPTALAIGTPFVSTTDVAIGNLYVCDAGNPNGGGAFAVGPWVDEANGTWDATAKLAVEGDVSWPMAEYSETVDADVRTITSNGLPVGQVTGVFPIAADDPAFQYDRNPNSIADSDLAIAIPVSPAVADTASCLGKGAIGVLRNGVVIFAPIDAQNRDAVAYETQDQCDGHPEQSSTYHYHNIPSCILDAATGVSTVVGYAFDGFPIVVERDADGNLPTNADLDECHGRTSAIELDGVVTEIYHYSATAEFPYFIGCFRGTSTVR